MIRRHGSRRHRFRHTVTRDDATWTSPQRFGVAFHTRLQSVDSSVCGESRSGRITRRVVCVVPTIGHCASQRHHSLAHAHGSSTVYQGYTPSIRTAAPAQSRIDRRILRVRLPILSPSSTPHIICSTAPHTPSTRFLPGLQPSVRRRSAFERPIAAFCAPFERERRVCSHALRSVSALRRSTTRPRRHLTPCARVHTRPRPRSRRLSLSTVPSTATAVPVKSAIGRTPRSVANGRRAVWGWDGTPGAVHPK